MQMSFFDGQYKFVNDKPIRLIELFGGFGNQAMNAVVEVVGADGVLLGKSPDFQRGPLKDTARTIMTDGTNGVVEWKK